MVNTVPATPGTDLSFGRDGTARPPSSVESESAEITSPSLLGAVTTSVPAEEIIEVVIALRYFG